MLESGKYIMIIWAKYVLSSLENIESSAIWKLIGYKKVF